MPRKVLAQVRVRCNRLAHPQRRKITNGRPHVRVIVLAIAVVTVPPRARVIGPVAIAAPIVRVAIVVVRWRAVQVVLGVPATIADLYDPEKMPEDLRRAHEANDEVLERIYIGRHFR